MRTSYSQIHELIHHHSHEMQTTRDESVCLGAIEKINRFTQEGNLKLAETLHPDSSEIHSMIELFCYASNEITIKLQQVTDVEVRQKMERTLENIKGRINDIRETARVAKMAADQQW